MSGASQFLTLDVDAQGVAHVGLNRPEVHNAFDASLIAEVTRMFAMLDEDAGVRLAVLYGHGKSFCAGGDLNWMRSMKDYSVVENKADALKLAEMYIGLRRFSKPLLGVVHGMALGGGSGLCAVCDYVVAAEGSRFGFTETRIGIVPGTISPFVMEKIGVGNARAFFLSGAPFGTEEALRMGLVHKVVAAEGLQAAKEALVADFLKAAPKACGVAKHMIGRVAEFMSESGDVTAPALTDYTTGLIATMRTQDEGQQGMAALLEKRKAPWGPQ
jgi:methylglutaconyl-CoA hydratase